MFFFAYGRIKIPMLSLPKQLLIVFLVFLALLTLGGIVVYGNYQTKKEQIAEIKKQENYWFVLYRKTNTEELYYGIPGEKGKSKLIKTFIVKSGRPNERPTPLPQLLGRKYWVITEKHEEKQNPETAPYFLTLDVPAPSESPYGPVPYKECNGVQCDWVKPGAFGLHGINGDPTRLSPVDPGSSGCIRHTDEDITYLYNLIDPKKEVRYYIDN